MRLSANQIAASTGGSFLVEARNPQAVARGLVWDSRTVKKDDLYLALPGQRVDGHNYLGAALTKGASVALVMKPVDKEVRSLAASLGAAIIEVPQTGKALIDLARTWRSHLTGHVIAITGSVGKTTTKNLVYEVLSRHMRTVATVGNQNNELGVPLTLLSAQEDTEAVVIEMGMRKAGQIADLCSFVQPDWGLIVKIGDSHIELLGSRNNIARAKAELFAALPAYTGKAFINADDEYANFLRAEGQLDNRSLASVYFDGSKQAANRVLALGAPAGKEPRVWAQDIELDEQGYPHFSLCAQGFQSFAERERVTCVLRLRGLASVSDACAAAAVACSLGIALGDISEALAQAEPVAGRQEVLSTAQGITVVNDTYNANPDSMRASLAMFQALSVSGRHVAVLGDMAGLGSYSQACHEGVGTLAASLLLDRLVCVGVLARFIAGAAQKAGMDANRIVCCDTLAQVLDDLKAYLKPKDAVLLKASHFIGLECVVEGLIN